MNEGAGGGKLAATMATTAATTYDESNMDNSIVPDVSSKNQTTAGEGYFSLNSVPN